MLFTIDLALLLTMVRPLLDRTLAELSGRTLVVATHDPARVERLATQRLALT